MKNIFKKITAAAVSAAILASVSSVSVSAAPATGAENFVIIEKILDRAGVKIPDDLDATFLIKMLDNLDLEELGIDDSLELTPEMIKSLAPMIAMMGAEIPDNVMSELSKVTEKIAESEKSEIAATDNAKTKAVKDLSITEIKNKTYSGKSLGQSPVIKDGSKILIKNTDYTLTYKNNTEIGTATVTIKGKGSYTGSVSKSFKIVPAKVKMKTSNISAKGVVKLSWDSVPGANGYEISAKTAKDKDFKVLGTTKNIKITTKELGSTKVQLKVRAYTVVDGKRIYGAAVQITVSH